MGLFSANYFWNLDSLSRQTRQQKRKKKAIVRQKNTGPASPSISGSASTVPHQYSDQYWSVFYRSRGWRLTTALCSGQRWPRTGLLWGPVTYPQEPDSGLQSGPGSLNHHDQKVDTVHESITPGGELLAPRDPVVSLIQTTNLSDSQIIGNLLNSVEKGIFTLIIHSIHACISSPSVPRRVRPYGCIQQSRKCSAWMEMNLSHWTFSFPLSSYLFLHSFVSPSTSHPFCSTGGSIPVSFTVANSQSPALTCFTGNTDENIMDKWRPWLYFLTFISKRWDR